MRKCSFLPMDRAVELTGMEYGGITPIGLPADWPVFVDSRVAGDGRRHHRLRRAPVEAPAARRDCSASSPASQVVDGLAVDVPTG